MKNLSLLILLTMIPALYGQNNTWTKVAGGLKGVPSFSQVLYSPHTNEFVNNFGPLPQDGKNHLYQVQVYSYALGKWINALPHDSLYGSSSINDSVEALQRKWADSTGYAYGYGRVGMPVFNSYYWTWKTVYGYLRPSSVLNNARVYGQGCLNSDNGKFYFYLNNQTISYDPVTRLFDTIAVTLHPNTGGVDGVLKWGSMVYDPTNKEILLFGGGGLDQPYGSPMTWTFNPATSVWTKRNLTLQPKPRAHSPMVYDPVNNVIVLFGGDHLDYIMNDTWVYHCATRTWEKKMPAISPKPRAGHGLYYLPKQGKIALMGGYRYAAGQMNEFEIWTYDVGNNSWGLVKRFASGETWPQMLGLNGSMNHMAASDTSDNIVAIADTAPSIYYFTPSTYKMKCDVSTIDPSGTATHGAASDIVVYTGSYYETTFGIANDPAWFTDGVAAPDTAANESFLRNLALNTWTEITPPKLAGGHRDWGTAILDPDHDLIITWSGGHVAHCGTDVPQYSISKNRWNIGYRPEYPLEYDGYNFPAPGPFTFTNRPFMPCHTVKSYAYDVNMHKMVFTYDYHTWIYDPVKMDWDSVDIHNPWGGGWGYNSGLVSTPHGVFNWFGNGSKPSRPYLFDTTMMNWRALPVTGTFPGFYADENGVTYDSKRDRVIWFGKSAVYSYSFADNSCVLLTPANMNLAVTGAAATGYLREGAYLPNKDVVLFSTSRSLNGELVYDCVTNSFYTIKMAGTVWEGGVYSGIMYDRKRNLVWHKDNYRDKLFVVRLDSATSIKEDALNGGDNSQSVFVSPNPFNPLVNIKLSSTLEGASVKIFDLSGRLAADLGVCRKNNIVWTGKGQPTGVYIVSVRKNSVVIRKEITLLK